MNEQTVSALIHRIKSNITQPLCLMEVCGTHTTAIGRCGIRSLLTPELELVSGPGCPVCVTSQYDLDQMILLSRQPGVTIATFGDMLRVPGSETTLELEKAAGADVRAVYSPFEAVKMAQQEQDRQFVFLGVGFETTAPAIAMSVELARQYGLDNYSVFSCVKTMPAALHALLGGGKSSLHGLILPGHVSAIIGRKAQDFVASHYHLPAAVTGFELTDILTAVLALVEMATNNEAAVVNCYPSVVREEGNPQARALIEKVFAPSDAKWRGLGLIEQSGLSLRRELAQFDARLRFPVTPQDTPENSACRCANVLLGEITPPDCALFGSKCNPLSPEGPCMVSSEGACAAYFRYERKKEVTL
ncbi:hydrogenase formation protein HypD [Dethiobacter alkaliphilus]|uniref:hydrogenase formation protein HypD n=1 Tax=Dethiobacter alkaliphilus TaxID=427926 RepID=UPI002227A06B|nr:hydrogenase formation protein HypD [Dethiobacter alkaliphilus]MCW3490327.1 hydrogenase formation protein HypD [Dethiobacter alkaliphilus]